ncbi:hypothetical protein ASE00_16605 [Sphingomonas sp. Root710]|uniref:FecR family protein n=1 Tax=Sphingomonas sp. Root710 TaxID=1736594 RepID=UPI0006F9FA42|nr:FecR domain-containing protein [Sphingomonas sp. Root710]KRB80658.1 hypothetical protein ASE00_16605 [Sphingomonas sp. Root710]
MHHDRLAAQHFLILRDPDASGEAIQAAFEWIDQEQQHRAAFDRVERFLHACDGVPAEDIARLKGVPGKPVLALPHLSRRMWALAASVLFLLIVGAGIVREQRAVMVQEARFETPRGTLREVQLVDGSNITLAGGTAVSVSYRRNARTVNLLRGEALFAVAPDKQRPFTVLTQNGSATALGTAFNVHRGPDTATVTVLHGKVEVLAKGAGYVSRATLEKYRQVQYSRGGEMSTIKRVDPDMAASWRRGEFSFVDTPLAAVIDDLNRYSARPIVIEGEALKHVKISGIVTAGSIAEWLAALPAIMDVQIVETSRAIRILPNIRRTVSRT